VVWFVVLVIIPGYISSRPAFLKRYPGVEMEHATWAKSEHAKVTCQQCHVPPQVTAQVGYNARMLGEFYLSIAMPGREPKLFAKPTNDACSTCHLDLRTVSPAGDLNIPHRAHVTVLKMRCIQCHDYVVHQKSPEGKNSPPMAGCLKCHDGKKAKNECSACHTDKKEPLTHRAANWLVVHPAKAEGGDCNTCHKWTEKWCSDCHAKQPRSHAKDWRATHGEAVAKKRNCETCHTAAFCTRCHGEVPKQNFDPAQKLVP